MKKIVKHGGKTELFDPKKLCNSIINAGASDNLTNQICGIVTESIDSGMSTENIFRLTQKYLMEFDPGLAAVYGLDRGLSALGPSGFIFEQYVAAMLREMGYEAHNNYYAKGEAVEHEIDVWAQKGDIVYIIEAKYRNEYKTKTHINQVMYADARLQDIRRRAKKDGDTREFFMWVITNTRFTDNAMNYVRARDVQLMGWDYPKFINLKKISYDKKLYPITVLPSITKSVLKQCAKEDVVLVRQLYPMTADQIQKKFSISARSAKKLEQEVLELMF